jgi:site-specific DNA recombinase
MIETSGPTVIYVRISDDPRLLRAGVDRQLVDCKALAKRLGWAVGEVYEDNDITASKGKQRPAYDRLLADIKAGKVRRLITDHPYRLYRLNTELEPLIKAVGDSVEIRTCKAGDIDLSTTTGRMVARILGATAQAEAETIRDRVRRKMADLISKGAWKGGPRPFGWNVIGGKFVEIPAEIKLLRQAKDRVLKGDSIRSICRDWRDKGVLSGRGIPIAETTLKKMLVSERVVGRYPNGVQGQWSAIFTEAEWQQVCVVLTTKIGQGKQREGGVFMLTGAILKCSRCGGPMYGRQKYAGRPQPYYSCHQQNGGCGRVAMSVDGLDNEVLAQVAEYLTGSLWADPKLQWKHNPRKIDTSPDLAAAMLSLSKVQERETVLAELVAEGQMSKADYMAAKAKLEPQRQAAQAALEATQAYAAGLHELANLDTSKFVTRWREMTVEERRKVVLALVTEIRVRPHAGHPSHPDPDRVEVDFRQI